MTTLKAILDNPKTTNAALRVNTSLAAELPFNDADKFLDRCHVRLPVEGC
jgi:hypothetical protein